MRGLHHRPSCAILNRPAAGWPLTFLVVSRTIFIVAEARSGWSETSKLACLEVESVACSDRRVVGRQPRGIARLPLSAPGLLGFHHRIVGLFGGSAGGFSPLHRMLARVHLHQPASQPRGAAPSTTSNVRARSLAVNRRNCVSSGVGSIGWRRTICTT
jgi:hypothetical protein